MSKLFANYNRLDVAFERGVGCFLYDTKGKKYLDFLSGIAVTSLGHSHPKLVEALTDQISRLLHVSNLYQIPQQEAAAEKLIEYCGLDKVFFCNSGAEANECLIKMARKYAHSKGLSPTLTVAHNGFHGRTMATVSATGTPKYQEGFQPLVAGFQFVDYNNLEQTLEALESSCGVLLEPVQGEGGVVPAEPEYLKRVEEACLAQGKLFLLDEVQTGIGRTGHWLAAHHYGVKPHAVSLAKGLGAGIPVGAVLATDELSTLMGPGSHGTTFGGNPLAARAVTTVLETLASQKLLENAAAMGAYFRSQLAALPGVVGVRGLGLMVAAVTEKPAKELAVQCLEKGLLINAVRDNVLRFLPPLIVNREEIDLAVAILQGELA
jgi:acetylornithine/N-succinyldiaminopimelate aminotransferase